MIKYNTLCYSCGQGESFNSMKVALAHLDTEVNIAIDNGWEPIGGIAVALNQSQGIVAQAIIKKEQNAQSK